MKKLMSIILCLVLVAGVCVELTFAREEQPLVGKEAYTRTNLKANGSTIFFHNMAKIGKTTIPVGTPVTIISASKKVIKFRRLDEEKGEKYKIEVPASSYDKYFVANKAELGLQGLDQSTKNAIDEMRVEVGMTKSEVYMSRGCPAWIALGAKSYFCSLDQIMNSDNWYYNKNKGKEEMIVHFENGVVSDVEKLK
jgi:hypothetical protein